MLNQIILVGRLVRNPEAKEKEKGKKLLNITLAVPRSFKNSEGVYETDFIDVKLWDIVANHTQEYCKKGDIVGIRGRIQTSNYEKDGETKYVTEIIGEKVTFLSSKKQEETE